ncbi:hypothetical protein D1872_243380 [compost metagenome]
MQRQITDPRFRYFFGGHRDFVKLIGSAQLSADTRHHLQGIKRFGDKIVGPKSQPGDLVEILVLRRQDDDRQLRSFAKPLQQLKAVEPRHHDIDNGQVHIGPGE